MSLSKTTAEKPILLSLKHEIEKVKPSSWRMCKASAGTFSRRAICLTPVTITLHSQTLPAKERTVEISSNRHQDSIYSSCCKKRRDGPYLSSAIADTGSLMLRHHGKSCSSKPMLVWTMPSWPPLAGAGLIAIREV